MIAAIEQTHGDRFGQMAERMAKNQLFASPQQTVWMCLNCGHVHIGAQAPEECPVCKHEQGFFVRVETGEILAAKR